MFMFGDFDFGDILEVIDTLVERKRGTYEYFMGLTIRDLTSIVNTVINKDREEQLKEHAGEMKGAEKVNKSADANYDDIMKVISGAI